MEEANSVLEDSLVNRGRNIHAKNISVKNNLPCNLVPKALLNTKLTLMLKVTKQSTMDMDWVDYRLRKITPGFLVEYNYSGPAQQIKGKK